MIDRGKAISTLLPLYWGSLYWIQRIKELNPDFTGTKAWRNQRDPVQIQPHSDSMRRKYLSYHMFRLFATPMGSPQTDRSV